MDDQLKDILENWAASDNRITAWPRFWAVRDEKLVSVVCRKCDQRLYWEVDREHYSCDDCGIQGDASHPEFQREVIWVIERVFLTERDANNHLKANHYHYTEQAHIWVGHFWRAPETVAILDYVAEKAKEQGIDYPIDHPQSNRPYPGVEN